jgi:hypothetical protein
MLVNGSFLFEIYLRLEKKWVLLHLFISKWISLVTDLTFFQVILPIHFFLFFFCKLPEAIENSCSREIFLFHVVAEWKFPVELRPRIAGNLEPFQLRYLLSVEPFTKFKLD